MDYALVIRKYASRHLLVALFLGVFTLARPAHADNTFLLQLGTFDSEDEATKKWDDVKSKNADVVGDYKLHIAEVALPPSNKTTYRAQVGPITSRDQAASLCSTLQSRSVECYVVETAMFGTGPAPDDSKEATKPAEETTATAPKHKAAALASEEDMAHADDPDYIPPPMDSGPVIISSSGASAPAPASPADIAEMPVTPPAHAAAPAPVAVAQEEPEAVPAPVHKKHVAMDTDNETPATSGINHFVPGREPKYLDASPETKVASATAPASPPAVSPAPAPKPQESRGFFSRLFGSEPSPAATEGVVGSVNVAEAVRVPLSTDNGPARPKIVPVLPPVHGLGGNPSDSTDKTLWAQISYFRDETQALTFYRQFSAAYPQFSDGVRIRITRPFGASSSAGKVSLRVGPFAGTEDVHTICAAANRWNARCTVVRDIGASTAMGTAPARPKNTHADDVTPQTHTGQYWAQLGTFNSSLEAWDAWRELKATHKKIASHMRPSVTTPTSSSAAGSVFRLRAGPYASEQRANDLCNQLQAASSDCLVVNDR